MAMTLLAGMWDSASARACQMVGVVSVDLALVILAAVGVDLSIMQWERTGAFRRRMRFGVVWKVPVLVGIAWGGAAILVWVTDGEWSKVAVANPTVLVALLLAGVTAGAVWYWLGMPVRRWWALLAALLLSAGLWM